MNRPLIKEGYKEGENLRGVDMNCLDGPYQSHNWYFSVGIGFYCLSCGEKKGGIKHASVQAG